jgi:hypothetical protein
MNKILTSILALLCASYLNASVTFSNPALVDTPGLASGQIGIMIVDTTGEGFGNLSNLVSDLSIFASTTYGSSLTNVSSRTASEFFGSISLSGGATFELEGGITAGDSFGIAVFSNSTEVTLVGDTITFWTDSSWIVPPDGSTGTFGDEFRQFNSSDSPTATFTVVPEPATYATLLGLLALGFVVTRRARR